MTEENPVPIHMGLPNFFDPNPQKSDFFLGF